MWCCGRPCIYCKAHWFSTQSHAQILTHTHSRLAYNPIWNTYVHACRDRSQHLCLCMRAVFVYGVVNFIISYYIISIEHEYLELEFCGWSWVKANMVEQRQATPWRCLLVYMCWMRFLYLIVFGFSVNRAQAKCCVNICVYIYLSVCDLK